jgi:hypothetical protein
VAAINFVHCINSLPSPSAHPLLSKVIKRLGRAKPQDARKPVSIDHLFLLTDALPSSCSSPYQVLMFRAMFLLSFFALLRVSELTAGKNSSHTLQLADVHIGQQSFITLRSYKHSNKAATIYLQPRRDRLCPISALASFSAVRGNVKGPFFASPSGIGVSRACFSTVLNACLSYCNLPVSEFKTHSFRIGGASFLALQGQPTEVIKAVGRWRSNSYRQYIRLSQ